MFKIAVNTSILPGNIFLLNDQEFYDVILQITGHQVIVDLLKAQGINNISAFLLTPTVFEVLTWEADEFIDLQKRCSIKLQNNTFIVRPGIKANVEFLRELFAKKNEEYTKELKEKQQNNQRSLSSFSQSSDVIRPAFHSATATANDNIDSFSTTGVSTTTTATINNLRRLIISTIEQWSIDNSGFFNDDTFKLEEGVNFDLRMQDGHEAFIQCVCKEKLILPKQNGKFIMSNYYRHIKENKKCTLMKKLRKSTIGNLEKEQDITIATSSAIVSMTVSPSRSRSQLLSQQSLTQSRTTESTITKRKQRSTKHDITSPCTKRHKT